MNYNQSYSNEEQKVSKYNEAGLQIIRLNDLWIKAEFYALKSNLTKWKFILDSIWRELLPDVLKHYNVKKFIKTNTILKSSISKCKNQYSLYHCLDKRHQFLKYIQDTVGKGSIYGYSNDEDAE